MATSIDQEGKCLCGKVQFTVKGQPKFNAFCHCKACSRACGMSPVHLIGFPDECFNITQGEENIQVVNGLGSMTHGKCTSCGVGIYQCPNGANFKAVFPTTFQIEDQKSCLLPADLLPTVHFNYENRHHDWSDSLPKFKAFPPAARVENNGALIE